jgi:D-glycero-D-manno-heptose 1,7-bisphosphate phosphatase
MSQNLIILDRDGVINYDSPDYIKSPQEWQAIPGSLEAIVKLNQHGYKVAIATNQSGLARGYFDEDTLTAIHQKMQKQLQTLGGHIDAIFYCPHLPEVGCACRKPQPGLLYQARDYFNIDLINTLMIGDSKKDLEAAQNAPCKGILVKTGNGLSACLQGTIDASTPVFNNLSDAVNFLIIP